MSFETAQSLRSSRVLSSRLGALRAPCAALLRLFKGGLGAKQPSRRPRGGGATPHACPTKNQLQNPKLKKIKQTKTKEIK